MRYLSVCSGIEAASVAWHPLGWAPVAFAEIEPFPCAVLAHHYPGVPNWGDLTRFREWPDAAPDVLVGGTPCQSFSVAGLRAGMADPRGNLALTFLGVADRYRPEWVVWENVPGVLSSNGGRDFGAFLGGLAELGYGWAYRILDAQHFGVPQRRRRVFVVGCAGGWQRAAAVLFERHSLSGHPAPRRETREGIAAALRTRAPASGGQGTDFEHVVANALNAHSGICQPDFTNYLPVPSTGDTSHCLNAGGMGRQDYETETLVAHSLRADGFDASEDGTGRGTPLVAFDWKQGGDRTSSMKAYEELTPTLGATREPAIAGPVMATYGKQIARAGKEAGRLDNHAITGMAVRRLTPTECERLQGFPDGYTLVPYRGKPASDGPRYKALGNSMAVPVMAWIGPAHRQRGRAHRAHVGGPHDAPPRWRLPGHHHHTGTNRHEGGGLRMVEKKTKKPRTKYGLVGMVRTPDFGSMTVSVDHGPPTEKRTAAFNAIGHALVMATSLRSDDALAELASCIMGLWEKHSPPKQENAGQGED